MNFLDRENMHNRKIVSITMRFLINTLRMYLKFRYNIGHIGRNSFIVPPITRIINADRFFIGENVRIGKHAFLLAIENIKIKRPG